MSKGKKAGSTSVQKGSVNKGSGWRKSLKSIGRRKKRS